MRSIGPTASFFPSSRYLADALIRPIDFRRARTIVELGPGTGAITNAILKRLRPDGRLLAIDINATFVDHLRTACPDSRLTLVCGCATDLQSLLALHNVSSVDAVVSSLGLTVMNHRTRTFILRQIAGCLAPGGAMTQYQYVGPLDVPRLGFRRFDEARFLKRYFCDVSVERVILNVPPALVFTCRQT